MKNLIGKKVRGFKFEPREGCDYVPEMDVHIGEEGTIILHDHRDNDYMVKFKDDYWYYPAELIEQHIVEVKEERGKL